MSLSPLAWLERQGYQVVVTRPSNRREPIMTVIRADRGPSKVPKAVQQYLWDNQVSILAELDQRERPVTPNPFGHPAWKPAEKRNGKNQSKAHLRPKLFHDDMTIREAREILRKEADGDGCACPVCTQFTKVYTRHITSSSAYDLIRLYAAAGSRAGPSAPYVKLREALDNDHPADFAKLVHWGLIEEEKVLRPDGGRAGFWRVTTRGEQFVLCKLSVPGSIYLFDSRMIGEPFGAPVTIKGALGKRFNYGELMDERRAP